MKGQRIAAFGGSRPRCGLTGEGHLLAAEARLVADDGTGATLTLQAASIATVRSARRPSGSNTSEAENESDFGSRVRRSRGSKA